MTRPIEHLSAALAGAAMVTVASFAHASETVLQITKQGGDTASLSMADLQDMPKRSFGTSTIWTDGETIFSGVELSELLQSLGIDSGTLKATAINDYSVEIPVSDAVTGGPIIAYARDGAPMPVRDKGPLWIVYPYDDSPEYQSEVIYSRSIWQLNRIAVEP